ncbi:hypothetical protein F4679DRAFT_564817 [Xylaria curta]|nr:hypothetical protein F4679DRAFT_564817 [Xylaria curta]
MASGTKGVARQEERQIRPVPFLHTTSRQAPAAEVEPVGTAGTAETAEIATLPNWIWRRYRSRDNRKGRHTIVISPQSAANNGVSHPHATDTFRATLPGLWRMVSTFPVFDVSYDVAIIFTLGSVIWVINGFFAWLPVQWPSTEFDGEATAGTGITAFVGATIFELGSVLLMLEAVNEKRTDCFGWAIEEAIEDQYHLLRPDPKGCAHHHSVRHGLLSTGELEAGKEDRAWEWWPTWYELKTHYFREIGFLASLSQFIGASVFWISGFTALPAINGHLSTPVSNGVYWLPQVVGGVGFIVSSWLFMLETQKTWYTPALNVLGWHIGFWNLIGAFGFTACGALGFANSSDAAAYASDLSTFIGSLAFLVSSLCNLILNLSVIDSTSQD